jgi:hypothetical protein
MSSCNSPPVEENDYEAMRAGNMEDNRLVRQRVSIKPCTAA